MTGPALMPAPLDHPPYKDLALISGDGNRPPTQPELLISVRRVTPMENILLIISWIAPPLLGAIIGYGTNRLAIRMLFRPLEPKRFWGRRIPFTPGIIPKSRDELAASVGSIVAKDLLSPDALRKHLDNPDFRASLQSWIAEQRATLMRRPLLPRLVPDSVRAANNLLSATAEQALAHLLSSDDFIASVQETVREFVLTTTDGTSGPDTGRQLAADLLAEVLPQLLRSSEMQQTALLLVGNIAGQAGASKLLPEILETAIKQLTAAPEFAPAVRQIADELAKELGNRRLDEVIDAPTAAQIIYDKLLPLLKDTETQRVATGLVRQQVQEWLLKNQPLDTLLTPDRRAVVQEIINQNLPAVTADLFAMLRGRDMQNLLVTMGRAAVNAAFQRQSRLVRFLADDVMGKRDEINNDMPRHINDIINRLEREVRSPQVQRQLSGIGDSVVNRLARSRPRDLFGVSGREQRIITLAEQVTRQALNVVAGIPRSKVQEVVEAIYKANPGMTLGQLLDPQKTAGLLADWAETYAKAPETSRRIAALISETAGTSNTSAPDAEFEGPVSNAPPAISLNELIPLTESMTQRIDRYATDKAVAFITAQLPSISRIVNVEELITNRIRDAEVAEVERMILQVSGKHLKWINWLGAMLGALIGCLQLALRAL